jgi:hypothetical protein
MLAIGPDTPSAVRPLLTEIIEALRAILTPGTPTPVHACTVATLPPAAAWPRTVVLVTDLNILAHSDGSHWIRQDTGGAI